MIKDISIIGAGNLSQSLLYRIEEAKANIKIRLYDKDTKKDVLAKKSNVLFCTKIDDNISKSNIIIIAVKPSQYKDVCINIKKYKTKSSIIVSLMAGVKINSLAKELGSKTSIIRTMTNINSKYGNASTFMFKNKFCNNNVLNAVKMFFNFFGTSHVLKKEIEIDKVTALVGSGPAYFIHFLEGIIQTFKNFGFSEKDSTFYAKELFYGTAITCINEQKSLLKIKNSVVSKGGTTDAALKKLTILKFQDILEKSIKEAYSKAKQLGKNK